MQQMHNAPIEPSEEDSAPLAAALMEVAPLVVREIRTSMRQHRGAGLSTPQFRALGFVRRHPGCSLTEVADHLGLSVPATSRLVDALVVAGMALRASSASDRRYVTLRLSAEGERVQAEARSAALKSLADRLAPLDPAQRAAIAQALEPLRQAFATPPANAPAPGDD